MIPRIIHLWWHAIDAPQPVLDAVAQWQRLHPAWDVRLWSHEPELQPARDAAARNAACVPSTDHIRHQANHVRWQLLHDRGGIWVDTDTTPLVALDGLIESDRPFCGRIGRPEPTVIGGPARHSLFAALVNDASQPHAIGRAPRVSGSHALNRCLRPEHDVRILEPGAFFDRNSDGTPIPAPEATPRYCTHRWDTSSRYATTLRARHG